MGSVQHQGKYIPNLLQICHPLRPLLKKNTKFLWADEQQQHFKLIKTIIAEATENKPRSGIPDKMRRISERLTLCIRATNSERMAFCSF